MHVLSEAEGKDLAPGSKLLDPSTALRMKSVALLRSFAALRMKSVALPHFSISIDAEVSSPGLIMIAVDRVATQMIYIYFIL